jgi:hypothetical protein
MSDLDFLAELDAEIAKVSSKADLTTKRKKAMSALYNPRSTSSAKAKAKASLEGINAQLAAIIWKPEASVAFFVEQSCDGCGSVHRMFLQYMQREVTWKTAVTTRWSRVNRPSPSLPREVIVQATETHVCGDCMEDHGFDYTTAEIKFISHSDPFVASPDYVQEELEEEETNAED